MFLSFFFLISLTKNIELDILFKSTFYIIGFGFIFYLSVVVFDMYTKNNPLFYGIGTSYSGIEAPPRSSGLSRLSFLVFATLFLFLLN